MAMDVQVNFRQALSCNRLFGPQDGKADFATPTPSRVLGSILSDILWKAPELGPASSIPGAPLGSAPITEI